MAKDEPYVPPFPHRGGASAFKPQPRASTVNLMRRNVPFAHGAGARRNRLSTFNPDHPEDSADLSIRTADASVAAPPPQGRSSKRGRRTSVARRRSSVVRRRGIWDRVSLFPREMYDAVVQAAAEWRADVTALPLETGAKAACIMHVLSFFLMLVRRHSASRSYTHAHTLRFQSSGSYRAPAPPAGARGIFSTATFAGILAFLVFVLSGVNARALFAQASYRSYTKRIGLVPGDRDKAEAEAAEREEAQRAPRTVSRVALSTLRTTLRWGGIATRWILRAIWYYLLAPPSSIDRPASNPGTEDTSGPASDPRASGTRTLEIWTPPAACLAFFCLFSPLHAFWYEVAARIGVHGGAALAAATAAGRSEDVLASTSNASRGSGSGWGLTLSWLGLLILSAQGYGLVYLFEQRLHQREQLASEVLYEYDVRFVQPSALPIVTEHATQTSEADVVQEILEGYPYPQYDDVGQGYNETVYY